MKQIMNSHLKQGGITLLFLLPLYGIDFFVEQNVSKLRTTSVDGCVVGVELSTGTNGIHNIDIQTRSDERLALATYNRLFIDKLQNEIGQCFQFTYYKHSFLIPFTGRKWLVRYSIHQDKT